MTAYPYMNLLEPGILTTRLRIDANNAAHTLHQAAGVIGELSGIQEALEFVGGEGTEKYEELLLAFTALKDAVEAHPHVSRVDP